MLDGVFCTYSFRYAVHRSFSAFFSALPATAGHTHDNSNAATAARRATQRTPRHAAEQHSMTQAKRKGRHKAGLPYWVYIKRITDKINFSGKTSLRNTAHVSITLHDGRPWRKTCMHREPLYSKHNIRQGRFQRYELLILKSATYRVSWEFTCKTTKILLLYIFLGHNRNVVNTKFPYPIKRLEVIRRFNQKSMAFNQSLS